MTDHRNGVPQGNNTQTKPARKPNAGGVLGLMSKRRWVIVVVFLSALTWSYTAGPPLSDAHISNRFFINPNRFDYNTEKIYGNSELIYNIFEPTFWSHTWIWQNGAYYGWIEGPTWFNNKLYFSDTTKNRIYSYHDYQGTQIEYENSGNATNEQMNKLLEPGSNGLFADPRNNDIIYIAQHASRRIIKLNTKTGATEIVASEYNGKRLNSPNDIVIDPNNEYLYFTDPIFGLQTKQNNNKNNDNNEESPISTTGLSSKEYNNILKQSSELGFSGLYRVSLKDYKIELIDKSIESPNGVGISTHVNNEERLYVTNGISGEFSMNVYKISKNSNKLPEYIATWDTNSIEKGNNERMINLKEDRHLGGWTDGFAIHPTMNYLFVACPEGKLCIINENNGKLEAAIKFADGVILSNAYFGKDNKLYLTANGNLWSIVLNKNNLPY